MTLTGQTDHNEVTTTIDDVATALGVSKGTVSRAITGNGRISTDTRRRVLDYMAAHDFHPNTIAQSLSRHKTMNLAFTVPNSRELTQLPFFLQALVGASTEAAGHGYDILVVTNDTDDVRRVVRQRKVDGVIVSRNLTDSDMLDYLAGTVVPFVLIGTTDEPGVLHVDHDNRTACRDLTVRLLERWPGRPGMIAGRRTHLVTQARVAGFLDAAASAPVAWDATDDASTIAAFQDLRRRGVTSFFCEDDAVCARLETALQSGQLGIDPASVNVAAFYDSPTLAALNPAVPVIRFDSSKLGATACAMLLRRIDGQPQDNVLLDYEVAMKGSRTAGPAPTTRQRSPLSPTKGKK